MVFDFFATDSEGIESRPRCRDCAPGPSSSSSFSVSPSTVHTANDFGDGEPILMVADGPERAELRRGR